MGLLARLFCFGGSGGGAASSMHHPAREVPETATAGSAGEERVTTGVLVQEDQVARAEGRAIPQGTMDSHGGGGGSSVTESPIPARATAHYTTNGDVSKHFPAAPPLLATADLLASADSTWDTIQSSVLQLPSWAHADDSVTARRGHTTHRSGLAGFLENETLAAHSSAPAQLGKAGALCWQQSQRLGAVGVGHLEEADADADADGHAGGGGGGEEPCDDGVPSPPQALELCAGDQLLRDLTGLTFIGHGVHSAVFKGMWHGAMVAIKFAASSRSSLDPDPLSAILRRTSICKALSHPNVLSTYAMRCCCLTEQHVPSSLLPAPPPPPLPAPASGGTTTASAAAAAGMASAAVAATPPTAPAPAVAVVGPGPTLGESSSAPGTGIGSNTAVGAAAAAAAQGPAPVVLLAEAQPHAAAAGDAVVPTGPAERLGSPSGEAPAAQAHPQAQGGVVAEVSGAAGSGRNGTAEAAASTLPPQHDDAAAAAVSVGLGDARSSAGHIAAAGGPQAVALMAASATEQPEQHSSHVAAPPHPHLLLQQQQQQQQHAAAAGRRLMPQQRSSPPPSGHSPRSQQQVLQLQPLSQHDTALVELVASAEPGTSLPLHMAVHAAAAAAFTAVAAAAAQGHPSSFVSNEGFGNPYGPNAQRGLSLRHVAAALGAVPGQFISMRLMEYADKRTLLNVLRHGVFLPGKFWGARVAVRALLRTACEVANGLSHLHSKGVVHGGLCSRNVLLRSHNLDRRGFTAKVASGHQASFCDHGTSDSSSSSSSSPSARWSGALPYTAPEVLAGGKASKASDVFSFGILLWEMSTCDVPYKGMLPGDIDNGLLSCGLRPTWPKDDDPAAATATSASTGTGTSTSTGTCIPPSIKALAEACWGQDPTARPHFDHITEQLRHIEQQVRRALRAARVSQSAPHHQHHQQHGGLLGSSSDVPAASWTIA